MSVFEAMHKGLDSSKLVSFDNEKLILIDKLDREIGFSEKNTCHRMPGMLHRAFSIFLFNHQNQVLIHKRSLQKKLWPSFWTNSCCSHPRKGENLEQAMRRRLKEELGLTCSLQYLYKFIYQAVYKNIGAEHELCHVYFGKTSHNPEPNPNEISDMKWISISDLSRDIQRNPENYTPWIRLEWEVICNQFLSSIMACTGH